MSEVTRSRTAVPGIQKDTVVPEAEITSYYGRPVIKPPTWAPLDIGGYLFLGGLAGASSVLAAMAPPRTARNLKIGALGAISLSTAALIHDLGKPSRFANMLRVVKPTSPMSMGSWILMAYAPAAAVAAATDVTGRLPRIGRLATGWAGLTGPAVASYTAVLIADTAVPAWHGAYRELPFVFTGSAAAAAGGLALLTGPTTDTTAARGAAVFGAALDLTATRLMKRRLGMLAEPYEKRRLLRAAELLTGAGAIAGLLFGRHRIPAAVAGTALLTGSALTRLAVFRAGQDSAADPKYTVVPQRERAG